MEGCTEQIFTVFPLETKSKQDTYKLVNGPFTYHYFKLIIYLPFLPSDSPIESSL